ncbi:MAG: SDR family oxidoreductase [Bacteroidetes bacterium]|nr:MAG: SDR family oxidoreductase [Bacteroidota bacterium]
MTPSSSPVYLLLGATGGIGTALAERLAGDGARLALAARTRDRLDALARRTGGLVLPTDATAYEQVEACVQATLDHHGRLDGIVNLVGSILLKPAHLTSLDEWRRTLALNLDTAFFTVKAAARPLMKQGGSIVLMASAVALTGLHNHEAIAAVKGGVVALARSAAATYARRGVRVNVVAPGLVRTPLTERLTANEASEKASLAMHALGRLGEPEDVAEMIAFLLDEQRGGWITGQVFGVDGGLSRVRPA